MGDMHSEDNLIEQPAIDLFKSLGYTHEKLLAKGLSAVIETLGEKGSIIYDRCGIE